MKLVDIHTDWTERLDAILEAYYIDRDNRDHYNEVGDKLPKNRDGRLVDTENRAEVGTVRAKNGLAVVYINQDSADYDPGEVYKFLKMVIGEFGRNNQNLRVGNEEIPENAREALETLEREGLLTSTSLGNTFTINLNQSALVGASTDAQAQNADIHGVTPDLIHKLEDALRMGVDVGMKGTTQQKLRKLAGNPDDPQLLAKAVKVHKLAFNGRRWPALEAAIVRRGANAFRGVKNDYARPVMSLFAYMNNLREPWQNGEQMAATFFEALRHDEDKFMGWSRYIKFESPQLVKFVTKRPKLLRIMVNSIVTGILKWSDFPKLEEAIEAYPPETITQSHPEWLKNARHGVMTLQGRANAFGMMQYVVRAYQPYITNDEIKSYVSDEVVNLLEKYDPGLFSQVAPPPGTVW